MLIVKGLHSFSYYFCRWALYIGLNWRLFSFEKICFSSRFQFLRFTIFMLWYCVILCSGKCIHFSFFSIDYSLFWLTQRSLGATEYMINSLQNREGLKRGAEKFCQEGGLLNTNWGVFVQIWKKQKTVKKWEMKDEYENNKR